MDQLDYDVIAAAGPTLAILIGRTNAPASEGDGGLTQEAAVLDALGGLGIPLVFDLEIGHVPPHLPLLNGATARVTVTNETHKIVQSWPRPSTSTRPRSGPHADPEANPG